MNEQKIFLYGSIIHVFEMLLAVIDININNITGDAMKIEYSNPGVLFYCVGLSLSIPGLELERVHNQNLR